MSICIQVDLVRGKFRQTVQFCAVRLIAHAIENSLAYRMANFRMKKSKIERTSKPATAAQQRISKRVTIIEVYEGFYAVVEVVELTSQ